MSDEHCRCEEVDALDGRVRDLENSLEWQQEEIVSLWNKLEALEERLKPDIQGPGTLPLELKKMLIVGATLNKADEFRDRNRGRFGGWQVNTVSATIDPNALRGHAYHMALLLTTEIPLDLKANIDICTRLGDNPMVLYWNPVWAFNLVPFGEQK